ncbi:MAG: PilZ domain-containing protein [Nitrospirota bacterium]
MDSRRDERVIVHLEAELIAGENRHACFIENLSPKGMYIVTAPTKSSFEFATDSLFELRLTLPSDDKIDLRCSVIWSYPTPPHGYTNSIGIEIIDPPPAYLEALKALK